MLNRLKQFFGFENLEDKLQRYTDISKSFEQVELSLDNLASTFFIERSLFEKRMKEPENSTIQNRIQERFDIFLNSHKEDIKKAKKEYDKVKKELDELEKSLSNHKYIRKKPNGKGGWSYVYKEGEHQTNILRDKKLGHSGKFITQTATNPKQTFKGIKNWLDSIGQKYDVSFSNTTSSIYIETKDENENTLKFRLANHSPAISDEMDWKGLKLVDFSDGTWDIEIDSSVGYKTDDIKNISSIVKQVGAEIKDKKIELTNEELYYQKVTNLEDKVMSDLGLEEDFYGVTKKMISPKIHDLKNSKEYRDFVKTKHQKESEGKLTENFNVNGAIIKVKDNWVQIVDLSGFIPLKGAQYKKTRKHLADKIHYELGNQLRKEEITSEQFIKEFNTILREYNTEGVNKSILGDFGDQYIATIESILKNKKETAYQKIKKSYQDGKISLESFNTVIKSITKEDKTRYADFILFNENGELLLLKRSSWEDDNAGAWVIPGGHVDPGEDFKTAAIRELQEESGYNVEDAENVGSYEDDKCHIEYFQAYVNTKEKSVLLQFAEVRDYKWIPVNEICEEAMVFNMRDNLLKILGIEDQDRNKKIIRKAILEGIIPVELIEKAKSGIYKPTTENKKLGRVGQKYGEKREESKEAFEDYVYHATNNAEDIQKEGFNEDKIKVAFLGKGFSFSRDPKTLENYHSNKNILKVKVRLENPVKNYRVWEKEIDTIEESNPNLSNKEKSEKLRDRLEEMGYDGVLAFREYGWFEGYPHRNDEVVAFRKSSIKSVNIEKSIDVPIEKAVDKYKQKLERLEARRTDKQCTKEEADYVDNFVDGDHQEENSCDRCEYYRPKEKDNCLKVIGGVSHNGHCKFWEHSDTDKSLQIDIEKAYLLGLIPDDLIEKAWKKQPIGTVTTRKDGQQYRKVAETGNMDQDWKLVVKDKTGTNEDSKATEHKYKPKELAGHAKTTSEENLQSAIKQSADSKVRQAAHEEIARREKEEHVQEKEEKKGDIKPKVEKKPEVKKEESNSDPNKADKILKYLRDGKLMKPSTERFYRENVDKYDFSVDESKLGGFVVNIKNKDSNSGSSYPVNNNFLNDDKKESDVKRVSDLVNFKELGHYNDPNDEYAQDLDQYLKDDNIDWRKESSLESLDPSKIKASEWNNNTDKKGNKKVEKYSKMDISTMPPIIAVRRKDGSIEAIDGIHRVWAAEKNGSQVPAIVITEKLEEGLNTSDTKMEQFLLLKYKNNKMDFKETENKQIKKSFLSWL